LNSIRYFLAPKDLFENIQKLEQELIQLKVEKETELRFNQQLLQDQERTIKEKELLISELKKELAEIKINAPAKLEAERRKRQSENVHTILSPKQLELFRLLSQEEKSYTELLETARINKLDIHDMPALRVQISRLNKKLQQETTYKIEKVQKNDVFYYRVS
jgi:hypothetical protein